MRRATLWFILAVLVQLAVLAVVPARKAYALLTGTPVVLRVEPADPYSVMSGHYLTLSYDVSHPGAPPPGWRWPPETPGEDQALLRSWKDLPDKTEVYVILKASPSGPWEAEAVHTRRPKTLAPGQVAVQGRKTSRGIEYGLEAFYFPEAIRERINQDLGKHSKDARVEAKVDAFGNAVLLRLMIQDRVYE